MPTTTRYQIIHPQGTASRGTKTETCRNAVRDALRSMDLPDAETATGINRTADRLDAIAKSWNQRLVVTADDFTHLLCDVTPSIPVSNDAAGDRYDRAIRLAQSVANHTGVTLAVVPGGARSGFAIAKA